METGLLIALGFAVAIIALAILLTRLFSSRKIRRDLNGSPADGGATATWIGIRAAGNHVDPSAGED